MNASANVSDQLLELCLSLCLHHERSNLFLQCVIDCYSYMLVNLLYFYIYIYTRGFVVIKLVYNFCAMLLQAQYGVKKVKLT